MHKEVAISASVYIAELNKVVKCSFWNAKQHHGYRYARFRGLEKVQLQCLLAAIAQNIKKMALLVFLSLFIP